MENNYEYGKLEGFLLVIYWCCIVGGALLIASAWFGLIGALGMLFSFDIFGMLSVLANTAASVIGGLLFILAADKLKKVSFDFYDTYLTGQIILTAASIASEVFSILSFWLTSHLLRTTFTQILSLALGVCLSVMYLSKSERVKAYFGERPLPHSKYWAYLQQLPPFITSEAPLSTADINIPKPGATENTAPQQPEAQPEVRYEAVAPQPEVVMVETETVVEEPVIELVIEEEKIEE